MSYPHLDLPKGLFHSRFPVKTSYAYLTPCVLHVPRSIQLPEQYVVNITGYEASHYVTFSILLLMLLYCPSKVKLCTNTAIMTPKRKRSNVHCRCVGDTDGKKLRTYAREVAYSCTAVLLSSWKFFHWLQVIRRGSRHTNWTWTWLCLKSSKED